MTKAATVVPAGPVLAGIARDIARLFAERETLIKAALDEGMTPVDILDKVGQHTTRTVNVILREHRETRRAEAFAATAELWKLGQVIEDRYGLRWRADTSMGSDERGWFCRSVGLRIFLSGERMADRGPLTPIRLDRVFAGNAGSAGRYAAVVEREMGRAEDEAVTVTPAEDQE